MADCLACERPQPDTAYVCHPCTTRLGEQLYTAAALVPELETAVAKLSRFGEPGPRSRGRAPAAPIRPDGGQLRHYADQEPGWPSGLPVNLAAAEVRDDLRNEVTTWARLICDERFPWPPPVGPRCNECDHPTCIRLYEYERQMPPPVTTSGLLRWLAGQLDWVRMRPWAWDAFDQLGDVVRRIAPAVDRPAERVDAGVCLAVLPESGEKCQRRLSAPPGAAKVRCPGCGATHDAQARRETLLAEARSQRGTATEVARWLTLLGLPTPAATVRKWAQRGRLACDQAGMYAFRDTEQLRMRESRSTA